MKYAPTARILLFACVVLLAGCDTCETSATLSSAFIKFNPQQQFTAVGCTVEQGSSEGHVNPVEVYGWRSIQGAVELPPNSEGCEFLVRAVRDALVGVVAGSLKDELTLQDDRGHGQPSYGLLRYTNEGKLGVVYVWLFPNESERRINYAILLHEELPRNRS